MATKSDPDSPPRRKDGCLSAAITFLILAAVGGFLIAAVRNTFVIEPQLEPEARGLACASAAPAAPAPVGSAGAPRPGKPAPVPAVKPCGIQNTRFESSPWRRAFEYEDGPRRARVECAREYLLFGEYRCVRVL